MKVSGRVVKRPDGRYSVVLECNRHPAQRCECGLRHWVERDRLQACPRCSKGLRDTYERRAWSPLRSGFKTKTEARRRLERELRRLDDGGDPFPEDLSVRDYVTRWLGGQPGRVRPRTLERYRGLLNRDVLPEIGDVRLDRLKAAHVRTMLDKMSARGLAPSTIRQARAVLSSALRQAVVDDLMRANPVAAVLPPKMQRPKLAVPNLEQVRALLQEARSTPWEVPILLAVMLAARRSEILALRWSDIGPTGQVRISRGLQRLGAGGETLGFLDPKTARARRTVLLPPFVVERLNQHRHEQKFRQRTLGDDYRDEDLVCCAYNGGLLHPDSFSKAFKRLAARAGLPPATRLHDLRHAALTELGRQGVHPVDVSAVAGHSSTAFTMSVYQHAWDEGAEQAADALARAFGAGDSSA